ncbi:MAG: hypothetical protein ACFFD4_34025 [Candidatus Odinarchaeota archaeon]
MVPDGSREERFLNRVIDVYLLFIVSILFVPNGAFHFVNNEPLTYSTVAFGFLFPEYWFIVLFGIAILLHHWKAGWNYQDAVKVFFTVIAGLIIAFFAGLFIRAIFFPRLPDCLLSLIWGASPCTDADFEGWFGPTYLLVGTCAFSILMLLAEKFARDSSPDFDEKWNERAQEN